MLEFLILLPLLTGLAVFVLPVRMGRVVLAATGLLHLQLTLLGWLRPAQIGLPAFFAPTPTGMLVLLVTSFIFVFIAAYGIFYMREQEMQSEPVYLGCMLLFLGTMSMAALADHPIVLWIAIEATTLASAPLIFVNRSIKALEATWKYVLICSVGIALALLGFFFITLSLDRAGLDLPLTFTSLNSVADRLDSALTASCDGRFGTTTSSSTRERTRTRNVPSASVTSARRPTPEPATVVVIVPSGARRSPSAPSGSP